MTIPAVTTSMLLRLAGGCAVASGVLALLYGLTHPPNATLTDVLGSRWGPIHACGFGAGVFGILAVVGVFVRNARTLGLAGLLTCAIAIGGLALFAGETFSSGFFEPILGAWADEESFRIVSAKSNDGIRELVRYSADSLMLVGFLGLGATLARVGPRLYRDAGWLLLASGPGFAFAYRISDVASDVSDVFFAVGMCMLGRAMFRDAAASRS